jgi:hypothetical protein
MSTIFLLSIMIFSQTQLYHLLKIPVLVQHFFEHKDEEPGITFTKFIVIHYFSGNLKDKDHDRDMQLPFKTNDCLQTITSIVVPQQNVISVKPLVTEKKIYLNDKHNWISSNYVMDIFQPPQFS